MTRIPRFLALAALLPLLVLVAQAASVDDVIAQARRYVGKERDLEALQTLRYRGRIEVAGPTSANGTIELILAKPDRQKSIRVMGPNREIVGLDGTEAWRRIEPIANPARGRTDILSLAELRQLQASTFENLSFYRGLEARGGRVEARGEAVVDGRPVVRLAFIHPGEVVFVRAFDKETGRLLSTESTDGARMIEEGEVVVQGIRFPRKLVSISGGEEAKRITVTITFEEIAVNETFPVESFAVPMPGAK